MAEHLPLLFFDWFDHLSKCQRCRIQAMTRKMLDELILEAYEGDATEFKALPVQQ